MKSCVMLANAISNLGNALTAAEWPVKAEKQADGRVKIYDLKKVYKDLLFAAIEIEHDADNLPDCVNELCLKCGKYREEHLGACKDCRWHEMKVSFRG